MFPAGLVVHKTEGGTGGSGDFGNSSLGKLHTRVLFTSYPKNSGEFDHFRPLFKAQSQFLGFAPGIHAELGLYRFGNVGAEVRRTDKEMLSRDMLKVQAESSGQPLRTCLPSMQHGPLDSDDALEALHLPHTGRPVADGNQPRTAVFDTWNIDR